MSLFASPPTENESPRPIPISTKMVHIVYWYRGLATTILSPFCQKKSVRCWSKDALTLLTEYDDTLILVAPFGEKDLPKWTGVRPCCRHRAAKTVWQMQMDRRKRKRRQTMKKKNVLLNSVLVKRHGRMRAFCFQALHQWQTKHDCTRGCTTTVLGVTNVAWYISMPYADWEWFCVEFQHVIDGSDTAMQLLEQLPPLIPTSDIPTIRIYRQNVRGQNIFYKRSPCRIYRQFCPVPMMSV